MQYFQLFWSFFKIGLFSIGGGYAALPLIQNEVVAHNGWLTLTEMADVVTLSQMTPGPIAINAATFVGTRIGGTAGAIIATLGCIAPSCIIVLLLAHFYFKNKQLSAVQGILNGLRPAVVSLIAVSGLSILSSAVFSSTASSWFGAKLSDIDLAGTALTAVCLFVLIKFKLNPILVMVASGIAGLVLYSIA
ncbi:MAG TPA: chromate transporter [Ruminococcaceae bacterium]|nr:chromate transporter [Oscillospiraceae bacterium]